MFGYNSAREAAEDWNNLQAAHYCCNAWKSDKVGRSAEFSRAVKSRVVNVSDGDW